MIIGIFQWEKIDLMIKESNIYLLVLFFSSTCSARRFNASAKLFDVADFRPDNDELPEADQLNDIWNDRIVP